MPFKTEVYGECLLFISRKIEALKKQLSDLVEDAKNDSKSTAGDKHETARAMMQIEQEKLGRQLRQLEEQKAILEKTGETKPAEKIIPGSLVKTNKGWIYLLTALGEIKVNGTPVFIISMQSPLAIKLAGLVKGEAAEINGTQYIVEGIS
ncbi:MAG: hypothetical protein FD123_354 [Bacteroidetes bacterium]|nr:MAG: hypothetical protein FD123_354 [Bacteroidota bacterium]